MGQHTGSGVLEGGGVLEGEGSWFKFLLCHFLALKSAIPLMPLIGCINLYDWDNQIINVLWLLQGPKELKHVLEECLTYRRCSVNVGCYCSDLNCHAVPLYFLHNETGDALVNKLENFNYKDVIIFSFWYFLMTLYIWNWTLSKKLFKIKNSFTVLALLWS